MSAFTQIPGIYNVPGAFTEVQFTPPDTVFAMPVRVLFIAIQQGLAAATLYQNVSASQMQTTMGIGSSASIAIAAFTAACPGVAMDVLALPPGAGAQASAATIVFNGPATASGTRALYVGGQRITFGVSSGDTPAIMAANFLSAYGAGTTSSVLAQTGLIASATLSSDGKSTVANSVTLTALEESQYGDDIDVRDSPYVSDSVAGATVTITAASGGAGAPSISAALGLISATWYTDIVTLLYDTPNLQTLAQEAQRRYGAMVKQDARVYAALRGSYGSLLAVTAQLNSMLLNVIGAQNPMWTQAAIAGAFAGQCCMSLNIDPSVQLRGLTLDAVAGMGPQGLDAFIPAQRNVLLGSGISTFTIGSDGTVSLERVVTTYQNAATGVPTGLPQDIMVPAIASRVRYDFNDYVVTTYPRAKLAQNNAVSANVPNVVTPKTMLGAWAARCKLYETNGWIEDVDTLAALASFSIDATDRNRLNAVLPIKPIGALIIDANILQVQG
ncbi:phage tail protein [Asaia bogorensis]|uniref:phage tail protein n=1 Tax=Asaia bogorensis TaxID=91915 RepID=UPI000EFCA9EB|nr:phage tail protein [Asaia bogorensis]